jgi:hypothetical protein
MSLVEQELLVLPEHLSSPFLWDSYCYRTFLESQDLQYRTIPVSDWLISKTIFSSETAWSSESHLVGSILGRFFIKMEKLTLPLAR